jgi:hypothetical protein
MALAPQSLARPMIRVRFINPHMGSSLAAVSGCLNAFVAVLATLLLPLFASSLLLPHEYAMEGPRRKFSKPPVKVACLAW